ncbi:hypothetical protein V6x_21130 [Gimesia chilikensis]|uniref:DUF4276 family protein n=1 Tax=Gimesia chilikensis TaxID=2605989 RepID=A0A517WAY0_9PLAN|nr:hypothetical protein [Gimesia chilikensis]QDU02410.1 hypothetical protein V6x_21130 [Gimesia chilikensis]
MKRPVVFLVADKNMNEVFKAFLERDGFHHQLQCGHFDFNEKQDLFRHPRNDPGVYNEAHVFLAPYIETHERAVVVLDAAWEGGPKGGAAEIKSHIEEQLAKAWEKFKVIVIEPELENWMWITQEQPDRSVAVHQLVAESFKYRADQPLKEFLQEDDNWRDDTNKPRPPKEAVERVLRLTNTPRSSALYRKIVRSASVARCQDESFLELVEVLRDWFPPEWAQ